MNTVPACKLRDGLSVCRVDGHLIFLDVEEDRYFRLPALLERAFSDLLSSRCPSIAGLGGLLQHKIIVETQDGRCLKLSRAVDGAKRSSLEQAPCRPNTGISTVVEVGALTCSTKWKLRNRRLRDVLADLAPNNAPTLAAPPDSGNDTRLAAAAEQFRGARRYVPVTPVCLLDSISMIRFLARRGLQANIVFGITYDPFSAHCWVQSGDLVLNDTVGNTAVYTPIRSV